MKSATLLTLRIAPVSRELGLVQTERLADCCASEADAKVTDSYHPASQVHAELQRRLDDRRKQVLG